MTLLALSMFAVSSTSRSTTPKPIVRASDIGFRDRVRTLEVSDRKSEIRGQRFEIANQQSVLKSREKSFVAVTTGAMLEPLSTRNKGLRASMRTAQVVLADNSLARVQTVLTMDCRSHYDPTYDLVVYGIRDNAAAMPWVETEFQAVSANLASELDLIFHELASRHSERTLPQAGAMEVDRKSIRWKALAVAVGGWLKYHVCQASEPKGAPSVGWADYPDFADRAIARNVATDEAAGTSDAKIGVRSSGWLRHSAALSLHQLSLILEAAAAELNGAGRPALSAVAQ
jgi:hypothetical protein